MVTAFGFEDDICFRDLISSLKFSTVSFTEDSSLNDYFSWFSK